MQKNHIKNHWEKQGRDYKESHWASWGDNWMIELEIENISKYISNGDKVLDVGCANGYSTFEQYKRKKLSSIVGIDYASSMIEMANKELNKNFKQSNIKFLQGDIRNIEFNSFEFDVVYTTRVIINLPTWEAQKQAINECIRVTKKGGTVIFSEGFWEPLVKLNSMRLLSGLAPLAEHDFNRYIKKEKLKNYLEELGHTYEVIDFSSIYYLGSRLLRELVTDFENYEGFSNPINKKFAKLQSCYNGGGFGIQQAFIINI